MSGPIGDNLRCKQASADQRGTLSRRELIRIAAGVAGAAVSRPIAEAASACGAEGRIAASGASYAPRFFRAPEFRSLASLAETVIPTDDHSPGAEAAGVHEFIDDMIADSDSKTQALWREGIKAVEKDTVAQFGKGFVELTAEQRTAVLEKVAANESHPETIEERFFIALKKMTIEGYYTSAVGIHQDLNYQGNTAMADFEGCKHPDHN